MTGRLIGQGIGKSHAHGAALEADQQVDVGDLITFANKAFTNVHGMVRHENVS